MIETIKRPKTIIEPKRDDNSMNYYVSEFDMKEIGVLVTISLKPCKDKTRVEIGGLLFRLIGVYNDIDKAISFIKENYPKAKVLEFGVVPQFVKYKIIKIFEVD